MFEIDDSSDHDLQYNDQKNFDGEKLDPVSREEMEERVHKFQVAINWPAPYGIGDDIKGSGVLISKDLVLTCAHNFYFKT